uniref:Uncharacterized protein n=1 Tax=Pyricularia oryzae (strain P131) TaxID=1143193 RepID=L7J2R2_PYRO1
MRRKKLRVVNVRARRPLERKWPPNRQILLESFLDYTLPFATVDHSPTKRICDRRAAFDAKYQIACPISMSEDRHVALSYVEPLDPKAMFVATTDKTTNVTHGSSATVFENKKLPEIESSVVPPAGDRTVTIEARKDGDINHTSSRPNV